MANCEQNFYGDQTMRGMYLFSWLLLFLVSCQAESTNCPPQGLAGTAWQMEYSMEIHDDTSFRHVPEGWVRMKTFTKTAGLSLAMTLAKWKSPVSAAEPIP